MTRFLMLFAAGTALAADHVVILGFDGMSPNGIQNAPTPVFHELMRRGAWTLHARGVIPTVSSPNWASMIMGAGPAEHGVTSNAWEPGKFDISPICVGDGGIFPTIFGLLRKQRPDSVVGVFHDWDGFARLLEASAVDVLKHGEGPDETMEMAIAFLKQRHPRLTFVHLDHVDHAGHQFGHGTPQYYEAVAKADALSGQMLAAIKEAGMADTTILLITADHGGVGKDHGHSTMAEIEIPWILSGPGVAQGRELAAPLKTYDTAATVAAILGVKPPECWIGRTVKEAFTAK